MSEEIEDLEKRLAKLQPLEQEALAAEILANWQIAKGEKSSPASDAFSPIFGDTGAASPRNCRFASLSLCSAVAGAIVGAAATFLGMAFFLPPKVEIREIVHEVHVQAEPETGANAKPENKPAAEGRSSPVESETETQPLAQSKARRSFDDRPTLSGFSFRDLDALVAQHEAVARQMARRDSYGDSTTSGSVLPRISPEEYRELLHELRL